jgi:superkiller protein 3
MKGYALMGEGQVDDALKLFQEAIRLNPRDARAHLNLGWALAAKGRDADALRAYEQAVALDPEYGLACNNLGNALMERNAGPEDLHRALDLFRKALELDPTLMRARRNLAYALYRMDRLDEALAAYVEIVQREPRNAPAHGSMSSILFRLGRPAEAMKELELAVSSDPGDVQAKNTLAWVLATFRDPAYRDGERAVRLAEELAEKTGRRDANVLDTLAAAYAEVGRYPDAVKVAEEALGHVRDEDGGLRKAIQARRDRYREERPFRS